MKNYILSIFCALSFVANSQDWQWAKNIGYKDYALFKITECTNQGFYLTGGFKDSITFDGFSLYDSVPYSPFIGRFNANGQCLWLKKTFRVRETCADSLGNIYLSGFFSGQLTIEGDTLSTSFSGAGILAKYSPVGNLLNLEKVDGNHIWCKIKVNSNQQLIVSTGYYKDSLNYKGNTFKDSTAVILKLNSDLNLLQSIHTSVYSEVCQLELDKNDTIYMVCNKDMSCMNCGITKIVKYTPNLTLLIDHYYSTGVGSHYYSVPKITCHDDGFIYVTQSHTYANNSVLKFSSQLNLKWIKGLPWAGSLFSRNSKLFVVGRTPSMHCGDSIKKSSIVIEVDTLFNCLWSKVLPLHDILTGPGPFFADAFVDIYNNIYTTGFTNKKAIFGSDTIGSNSLSVFTAKLDYSKITIGLHSNSIATGILIFPNPSYGVYTIKLNDKKTDMKIFVYDVLGNLVFNKHCQSYSEAEINITNHPKGIYFLEIIADGLRVRKKIVLQ